jgi:hypothetical protein
VDVSLTVVHKPEGYCVVDTDGRVQAGPFDLNSSAWRALDRMDREPVSKREDTGDWVSRQILK